MFGGGGGGGGGFNDFFDDGGVEGRASARRELRGCVVYAVLEVWGGCFFLQGGVGWCYRMGVYCELTVAIVRMGVYCISGFAVFVQKMHMWDCIVQ